MFDINLLPMNLTNGRNMGDLPGLFLFTAPRRSEKSREADILVLLLHEASGTESSLQQLTSWAETFSNAYFQARGSFTMGVSSAVKSLAAAIEKCLPGKILPTICLNIAILRGNDLLLTHVGPVCATVISSDHVQTYHDETALPLQYGANNELRFYQTGIHSEDLVLLCPLIPQGWTNSAILEATEESPLNVIRYLLDQSHGNIQCAVMQIKTGKGNITFRRRASIIANVEPENRKKKGSDPQSVKDSASAISSSDPEKPLFHKKSIPASLAASRAPAAEPVPDKEPVSDKPIEASRDEEKAAAPKEENGKEIFPASEALEISEGSEEAARPVEDSEVSVPRIQRKREKKDFQKPAEKPRAPLNPGRFLLILLCGLLIPLVVVASLFFVYSGRSKDKLHRDNLAKAVSTAQNALNQENLAEQEKLWTDTLDYTNMALAYGKSRAAQDLRAQALASLDTINGAVSTVYNYGSSAILPQGLNLVDFASDGQYVYALDDASGSVLRLLYSGSGVAIDNKFSCTPGIYETFGEEQKKTEVGKFVDFIVLPSGNPHNFLTAAVDRNANVLYCSSFSGNKAAQLPAPEGKKITVSSIAFYDTTMYVLDTQDSNVWKFPYSYSEGFAYPASNYFGSSTPILTDIVDFTVFKEYSYYLRENGTLLYCDYTGYKPVFTPITEISREDTPMHLNLKLHHFSKIQISHSPDNSVYLMDDRLQSILNLTVKTNFIRYIVPDRSISDVSVYGSATGFGITNQNRILWAYQNDIYTGNLP